MGKEDILASLNDFVEKQGWKLSQPREINYGIQAVVADGPVRLSVNIYNTGRIVVQGKECEAKKALNEWADQVQSGTQPVPERTAQTHQNRLAKYLVPADKIEKISQVLHGLPGQVTEKQASGPAEVYRIEARHENSRVTITQYRSGTLMVQGVSSPLFDTVCDILDQHLAQSFSEHVARFIPGDEGRQAASAYLEKPDSENEAARWLSEQIPPQVLDFLHDNDRRTLLAAAGVRNVFHNTGNLLPDYSVVVMPFAKVFEGFMISLAVHLGLTTEKDQKVEVRVGQINTWLEQIEKRLPDPKRHKEVSLALNSAWQCRNRVSHSDRGTWQGVLTDLSDAEQDINTILRAMKFAYTVFVENNVRLSPRGL